MRGLTVMENHKEPLARSLLEILAPPQNPWLKQFVPGITHLPTGVRIIRHAGTEDDQIERNERLRIAKRKLHHWNEG